MKKAVTFHLHEDLLSAARDRAVREHRTPTNFVEARLRDRTAGPAIEGLKSRRSSASTPEGPTLGE